ncbi:MAG: arginine--tRNA ligase [Bauldia sp.]|nr:arginine--tRNA ligase [Bauldia sp.]
MNVFEIFTGRVIAAVEAVLRDAFAGADAPLGAIVVEPPRDRSHGELSTNAAMVLAKPLAAKPRDIAEKIAAALRDDPDIASVEIAGPGFINLTLTPHFWLGVLAEALRLGPAFGRSTLGGGEPVNVEFVSANPTGPMHVGHCRGAVVGDTLASLLEAAGYNVTREYYINDAGAQVDVLAQSAFLRYREALGEDIGAIPAGLYPGDYLKAVGRSLAAAHGPSLLELDEDSWLPIVRPAAIDAMMAMIRDDLAALNIAHDVFFSERALIEGTADRVAEAIEALRARDLVYVGRLPPPKGQPIEDWEDREQTLFRATAFGDDVDRPLLKSDGGYTYFASDIAYHYDKYRRGFRTMIDVWGADHGGYIKRMQAAVAGVTAGEATLDVKICQLVKLFRAGEPVKMSKRSGDFVTLRDVVDEVGPDPVRFMMVYRRNDAPLDFDFQKVTEQSKDNPVFYVQYAHARGCSVLRQAAEADPELARASAFDLASGLVSADYLQNLADPGEIGLIRTLAEFPRIIEAAAVAHEPHRVAFYLHELAAAFHAQWNRGNEAPELRFINHERPELTLARLALVRGINLVLSTGLAILGVNAPEEMR